ncbi:MAG: hypothetical protein ACLQDA_10385 [Terracidiphilus sp.]|jgi:hypothetical protein
MQEPKLSRRTAWLLGIGIWGTALLVAVAISHFAKLNLWACLGMVAGAVVINGLVATLEDDQPGGFNNPDGEHTPRYVVIVGWVGRGLLVVLVLFCLLGLGLYFFGSR